MILFQTETSDEKCKSLLYTYDKYISKWWIIKKNGKHTNRIIRFIYTLSGCRRMQTMNNVDALGNLEFQIN